MGNSVNKFFKENRKDRKPVSVAVTKRFTDEKGEAVKWELRPISSKRMEQIRNGATNKDGKLDGVRFAMALTAASVFYPPLNDANLQDSYGVKKPEDLLYELTYPDELDALQIEVLKLNGYGDSLGDLVNQAKN